MPRLADPSGIRSRPASVALGELAIAAGLVGESVTIACDFPANTLCQVWKYYTQALGSGNVIQVRAKQQFPVVANRSECVAERQLAIVLVRSDSTLSVDRCSLVF